MPGVLFADTAQSLGQINPFVYGANYGPWVGVLPEMMPAAEASGVTYLRWPGGNWGDDHDVRDYQIDQYIQFARQMEVEPSISVRVPGGSPEKAAELVRYTNVENDYNVRYWAIGNEPSLYDDYDTERFNTEWRSFAEAMLAVDPDILLLGPEPHQYTGNPDIDPRDEAGRDWVREFLLANGDLVDIVAIHRYPFPTSMSEPASTIDKLRANSREWDTIIPNLRVLVRETIGRDLPVAVTEINSHWSNAFGGEATPDSFYNAIWWADSLGRMIRQGVDIVAYFLLQSPPSIGGYGLLGRYDIRPTYYVYQIYQHFGDELVYTSSDNPDVGLYAALRDDGALTLVAVNLSPEEIRSPLEVVGGEWDVTEAWLFDEAHPVEQVEMSGLVDGQTITLPAQSVSLLVFERGEPTATGQQQPSPDAYLDPGAPVEDRVESLLSQMTLAEKIGQMTQAEKNSIKEQDITDLFIGSLLSGGGGYPQALNTPQSWADMVNGYQEYALETRLGIPLIYGVDAVHGHAAVDGAVVFPHNIGLGATRDPDLVTRVGEITAKEMAATGIYWNFGPVVAVSQDIRWGRTYESYSEDTSLVSALGSAYVRGLQNDGETRDLSAPTTVLATPKHYVGDGGTAWGTSETFIEQQFMLDQGVMTVDEATVRAVHLPPYEATVAEGALSIMASFSSWGDTKLHAHKYLLTDVLKGELGFEGFIVSDWAGIDQIPGDYYGDVVTSINAGVDMVMVPIEYQSFIAALTKAVETGDVPLERVDDAVRRILRAKFELGLFEHPFGSDELLPLVGSPEHRSVAREAVRKSLVLLKNENNALPIAKDTPLILVAGMAADDLGMLSGGWTIEWQGIRGNVIPGTSIKDAIASTVSNDTMVQFNRWAKFDHVKDENGELAIADVGIVVVGEEPYAEGIGDSADLSLSEGDLTTIDRLSQRCEQLVVILVSSRPMIITEQLDAADAFVAAWLPGTEGQGVADVLFGDHEFSGKLPYTWPRTMEQLPFDFEALATSGPDAPLFPFGYGLSTSGAQLP